MIKYEARTELGNSFVSFILHTLFFILSLGTPAK
jgi:hypothetical protein